MIKALVVYCHPNLDSYTAGIRDLVLDRLNFASAEIQLIDLYAINFKPVLEHEELVKYLDIKSNQNGLDTHIAMLNWCNTLIFVYPTWWYGLPAMLKGWLDRTLLPGVAFHMPGEGEKLIKPGLINVTRLGVFTTCGASWWLTQFIGAPGKRTILRGVRSVCASRVKTSFAAHYLMDQSSQSSRNRHMNKVKKNIDRLLS